MIRLRSQAPGDRWNHVFSLGQPDGDSLVGAPAVTGTPAGLTIETPVIADNRVVAWISGGAPGTTYELAVTCGTARGLRLHQVVSLHVGPAGLDDETDIGAVMT